MVRGVTHDLIHCNPRYMMRSFAYKAYRERGEGRSPRVGPLERDNLLWNFYGLCKPIPYGQARFALVAFCFSRSFVRTSSHD